MHWKARLAVLAAALWWGSLTAIGFVAVPLLFAHAPSSFIAGHLASRLFTGQTWVSLCCGLVVLMGARDADGTPRMGWAQGAVGYVLLGLLAALLQEFAIAPHIIARQDLAFWHSFGTGLYAAQWLCALVVLWKQVGLVGQGDAGTPTGESEPVCQGSPPGSP
jgi:hypothetical protein